MGQTPESKKHSPSPAGLDIGTTPPPRYWVGREARVSGRVHAGGIPGRLMESELVDDASS